ncbi:amidase [Dermatophilus congolensis]|uniref:amidase n=3 Tax=Dermatophilus congolensis TaxID=1863 RepID=UPI001AAEB39F|nr:amidase family protein [Dermatophilus congolensis]MBO3130472.1 amidase [Dermatophilus congolensis]MBO3130898.1 amidase [Dermatophilus congolensis]MBO3134944.1 amidase [Dermatophilus congolensis]MBO3137183.1 amidase [Dermatophilus congolensis]MBO3139426.1 amidase [Dermatophilus congolensis]
MASEKPTHIEEMARWSITETIAAIREGRATARLVTEAAIARIERANPHINAVHTLLREQALADAEAIDPSLPLAGVPTLIKAEHDIEGIPTTLGGYGNSTPAQHDSAVVSRLRAAGAIILGTTHMPEFGQFPWTEGASFGHTRNPWNLHHSTGGSSGGSAAAVAAGCVPFAIGSDGGGSIRIPASCCGLIGLKPVRGRVSTSPWPDLWGRLGTIGPLTRTAADTALVYDIIAGPSEHDAFPLPRPYNTFTDAANQAPQRLRIAWLTSPANPLIHVERHIAKTVHDVARTLAKAGHTITHLTQRWPNDQPNYLIEFAHAIAQERKRVEHPNRLETRTRHTANAGRLIPPALLKHAHTVATKLAADIETRFAEYDIVITPTIATAPPKLGQLDTTGSFHALIRSLPMVAFTTLANTTGHASLSFPASHTPDGLPIGIQLYAPGGDEQRLLTLAAQLERLLPNRPTIAPTLP